MNSMMNDPNLIDLIRKFSKHREASDGGRRRIPKELRMAALQAVARGVSKTELHRSCGISPAQLSGWRRANREKSGDKERAPQILSVVDSGWPKGLRIAVKHDRIEFEIGLR